MVQGLRDFRVDKRTPHADAFGVFVCSFMHSVLRIDAMLSEHEEK